MKIYTDHNSESCFSSGMYRGLIVFTALLLNAFFTGQAQDRPNILFIICDDLQIESTDPRFQSFMSINYFNEGNNRPHTPTLDSLAGAGLEFTRAYTSSTTCSPARYTVLSGRYAGHNKSQYYIDSWEDNKLAGEDMYLARIENNNIAMEKGGETYSGLNVQTQLSNAGYFTGIVGKWHLGPHLASSAGAWENNGLTRYSQTADPATNNTVNNQMKSNQLVIEEIIKSYGWDWAGNIYIANTKEIGNDHLDVHNIEWTVQGAFEFLDQAAQNPGDPFFLYFSTTLHHGPGPWGNNQLASTGADVRYTGEGYFPEGVQHNGQDVMPGRQAIINEVTGAGKREEDAWTALVDKGVEAVLNRLDELNMAENTMVIFTSDHGYDRYGKASLLEGGIRVPLFITWKNKIPAGSKIDQLVQNIDYAPTFFHYAGVLESLPEGYLYNGRSLHPYIENQDNSVVLHSDLFFEMGYARGVITKENKYIAIRYPNKVNQQIENGETWTPFMDGDPLLSQPYLLENKHLGHWSSTYNTQYFNVDQYYDYSDDPEDFVNLLYDNNETPLAEEDLTPEVQSGVEDLQARLSGHLNQFEDAYFGEFHDGVMVNIQSNPPGNSGDAVKLYYNGGKFIIRGKSSSVIKIYNVSGNHLRTLPADYENSISWDGKTKLGQVAPAGIYTAILEGNHTIARTSFVAGL